MTSLLSSAAQVAHKAASNLLSAAEIKIGETIPPSHSVKEDSPEKSFAIQNLQGKNIFVREQPRTIRYEFNFLRLEFPERSQERAALKYQVTSNTMINSKPRTSRTSTSWP